QIIDQLLDDAFSHLALLGFEQLIYSVEFSVSEPAGDAAQLAGLTYQKRPTTRVRRDAKCF
ncbi:hypothetical protein BS297_03790, partial [Rhodococcus erythropolis]